MIAGKGQVAPGFGGLRIPAWRWWLAALLSAVAIAVAARAADVGALADAASLGLRRPMTLAGVLAAYSGAFVLRACAWRLLSGGGVPARSLHSILQASLWLNHVMPLKAGELARPALAVRHGMPGREAVASSVIARAMDFAALALIAGVSISVYTTSGPAGFAARLALVAVLGGIAALVFVRARTMQWLPGHVRSYADGLRDGLASVRPRAVAMAAPLVVASWMLEASVLLGAASFFSVDLSWRVAVGATAFTILFQAVHLTPGGLGVYEASMTAVLVSQGLSTDDALALAVLTHAMKFGYAFSVGSVFAASELVFVLRGQPGEQAKRASRFEVVSARLWNVLNEGKPFTVVFTLFVIGVLGALEVRTPGDVGAAGLALGAVAPLAALCWRFDFPLKLRTVLWICLLAFVGLTQSVPLVALALVVSLYVIFTVVLWGTVYYHLRIGTPWTNGFRFARLVAENPDPTSGNLLEQLPKVLLLVFAFEYVTGSPGANSVSLVLGFAVAVGIGALLLHQWFFTWVPALPQRRILLSVPEVPPRRAKRVIAIVIDGCRADRLDEARTAAIDGLRAKGTEFREMNTVYPARTVTCFSSMLTGAAPAVHGMRSNFVPDLGVKCESVFDVLRAHGMSGKLVGIAHLVDAFGNHDVRTVTAVMDNADIDDALIGEAKAVLSQEDPELLVLQLLSVDQTGHARGSYNAEYLDKIEETDAKIGAFLAWCEAQDYLKDALVMVTADHGQGIGIGGHGHLSEPERRIPCIVAGPGFEPGAVRDELRFITDFAPTICGALGLPAPSESVGRALSAASTGGEKPVVFVIPARNEEGNLPAVLAAIADSGVSPRKVVVVDDGSADSTAEVARTAGCVVRSHATSLGLGAALRTGLAVARGLEPAAVVYLDADGEYDARESTRLLAPILAGEADYVLGCRAPGRPGGMKLSRRIANRAFTLLLCVLSGRRIRDGQTGFRAFSPRAVDVAEVVHDYNYAQVLTLDMLKKGMRLRQAPVSYRRRTAGASFVRGEYLWRVPLGMMKEMLRA